MRSQTRVALLATIILATAALALAKYVPPRFHDLAGLSDAVVLGTIARVDAETFTLRPEEVLSGAVAPGDLVILRFENWTCSHRWKPYAVGQREIAFLQTLSIDDRRRSHAAYRLRSSGDEAEWEIAAGKVSVQGFRVPGGVVHDEGEHPGQWLPLDDVLDALRTYRRCFSVRHDPAGKPWELEVDVLCDAAALQTFRRRSTVHEYLAARSLEASRK